MSFFGKKPVRRSDAENQRLVDQASDVLKTAAAEFRAAADAAIQRLREPVPVQAPKPRNLRAVGT